MLKSSLSDLESDYYCLLINNVIIRVLLHIAGVSTNCNTDSVYVSDKNYRINILSSPLILYINPGQLWKVCVARSVDSPEIFNMFNISVWHPRMLSVI